MLPFPMLSSEFYRYRLCMIRLAKEMRRRPERIGRDMVVTGRESDAVGVAVCGGSLGECRESPCGSRRTFSRLLATDGTLHMLP